MYILKLFLSLIGILAALNAYFLPVETLGLNLSESGHQVTKGRKELPQSPQLPSENNETND